MEDVLRICIRLALEAGKAIMEIYKGDFEVYMKEDKSPLTEADKKSNQIIVEGLKAKFPDYAILAEESKDDGLRLKKDWCFIIDPLDGTKEFIKHNGQFTVNIALTFKGNVITGVIYVPAVKEIYYAVKDKGAYFIKLTEDLVHEKYAAAAEKCIRNAERIRVTNKTENLIVVGSRSHMTKSLKELIEKNKEKIKEIYAAGSSLKGCMIAKGEADVYYRFGPTMEWDTAAMQCIVEEAGGILRQMDNSKMTYNRIDSCNSKGFYIVNDSRNIWV